MPHRRGFSALTVAALAGACLLPTHGASRVDRSAPTTGDLEVTLHEQDESLTVSSRRHRFALNLPHSDTWRFDSDERRPLGASDDRWTLDIRARERTEGDAWSQLDEYLDELVGSRADIRFPQIVEEDDGSVICVQVRNGEQAPWRWFYWAVIPSGKRWLQLALLDTRTEPLEPYDLDVVRRIASGFVAVEPDPDGLSPADPEQASR